MNMYPDPPPPNYFLENALGTWHSKLLALLNWFKLAYGQFWWRSQEGIKCPKALSKVLSRPFNLHPEK